MVEERAKRKLSALLSADVKGYSRLMGVDETGTVNRLKKYRALMTGIIQQYRGRVVDSPGDNIHLIGPCLSMEKAAYPSHCRAGASHRP